MKANLLDVNGKKLRDIEMPKCFSKEVRKDIIAKIIEAKKKRQPYGPSPVAGNQYSASGVLIHQRKVWKSQYGRGISRVPRKIMTAKGSQFNWVGATSPNTRGGRKVHSPKVISMINTNKINKKELKIALMSALSATTNPKEISERYARLKGTKISNLPLVVESKIITLKTKDLISSLKKVLGKELFDLALQKKEVRSGRGSRRGRKYKNNAGLLMIIGKDEKIKTTAFDVSNTKKVGVVDLASGGPGRLTLYTETAIKELGENLK